MTPKATETVGDRLKAERERRKMTLMQFAVLVGASDPGHVLRIENGDKEVGRVVGERIAAALGWSLDYLFTGKEHKKGN